MNKLLLVVGAIFIISIIVGYIRGFLKIALSLVITVASLFLVLAITPYISNWIQNSTAITETVQEKILEGIELPEGVNEETLASIEIPREQQIQLIEGAGLPSVIQQKLLENNNSEAYSALGVTSFASYISAYVTKWIADILAFLIAWLVVGIISKVLMSMIKSIEKIPVVGGINKIAGAIVGVGIGFVVVWGVFILVTLLYNTEVGQMCMQDIEASQILSKLYDGNILMKYITKF